MNTGSLRQLVTPDHLLGRMHTSFRFIGRGSVPAGALAGGLLGELVGARVALGIGVLGMFLVPLWLVLSPVYRVRRLDEYRIAASV